MTKTSELLPAVFEAKQIRVIEQDERIWFPLVDLSNAWGIHRNTLRDIVNRNPEKFEGFVTTGAHVTCAAGLQVVDERGLYLLMGSINTARMKDKNSAEVLLRFQRWVPELIQKYRKNEIMQMQLEQGDILKNEVARAKMLAQESGGDLNAFLAVAFRKCGLEDYVPALNVPRVVHGDRDEWLNATQLGNRCGHSAQEVNHYLSWHKYQYKDHEGLWRLTDLGEQYGEEYWFESTSKHREIRIRWRKEILAASGLTRDSANL